MDCKLQ
jgi:hypothetical protein